jgi:biopolymer transport protein ExbD
MALQLAGAKSNARYAIRQNADINVTPFVDVMLVLLIIFMVAAPMATVSIKLDLPASGLSGKPDEPTFVSLTTDGRLFVTRGQSTSATDLTRLAGDVAAALGTHDIAASQVFIRADRHVSYGKFMAVMNALKLAGYQHIGLVSEAV